MATREEKEDLRLVRADLQTAVRVIRAQAPAIRDAAIRQRMEYVLRLVSAHLETIAGVIGDE